jgi:hypothetical protein
MRNRWDTFVRARILTQVDNRRRVEVLAPLAAALSLIIACLIKSPKRSFWNDELYSWYFLSDPSIAHMWRAFNDAINTTPYLYFGIGWLWAKVFGPSETSLRLFSCIGFSAAIFIIWAMLRRNYSFWPSTASTLVVLLTSKIALDQSGEARMYGLFLLLCAAAVSQYDRLNRSPSIPLRQFVAITLLHAAIVHTHIFGLFYSGAILAACVTSDYLSRNYRPRTYWAIVLGQMSLVLYLPSFLVQAEATRPRGWIPSPTLNDLIRAIFTGSFINIVMVSALFFILFALHIVASAQTSNYRAERGEPVTFERSLLVLAFAFLTVAPATWLFSRLTRPIFLERYLIPSLIAYAILIAHLTSVYMKHCIAETGSRPHFLRTIKFELVRNLLLGSLMIVVLCYPIWDASKRTREDLPGSWDASFGFATLPIVVQSSHRFLETVHYRTDSSRYFFVLDKRSAYLDASGSFGPQEFNHMLAFKRNYPVLGRQILPATDFLRRYDRFLVIAPDPYLDICDPKPVGLTNKILCPQWVRTRLLPDPKWKIRVVARHQGEAILLVEIDRVRLLKKAPGRSVPRCGQPTPTASSGRSRSSLKTG